MADDKNIEMQDRIDILHKLQSKSDDPVSNAVRSILLDQAEMNCMIKKLTTAVLGDESIGFVGSIQRLKNIEEKMVILDKLERTMTSTESRVDELEKQTKFLTEERKKFINRALGMSGSIACAFFVVALVFGQEALTSPIRWVATQVIDKRIESFKIELKKENPSLKLP